MIQSSRGVFLSYASEDAGVAIRICDALRMAGIEVWFDQSELRGGDAWDQKIRQQIRDCALFVPIISAHTQTRAEGYFRLEWKLAVDRSHLMAAEKAFLVPVVVDETTELEALVPAQFRDVQWTRIHAGEAQGAFVHRIAALLNQPVAHHVGTPERVANRAPTGRLSIVLIALSAAAVAGLVIAVAMRGAWLWHKPVPKVEAGPTSASESTTPATIPEKSIAVLPFENRSAKQDDAYFTDGIHDDILTQLTKFGAMKVIARTSVEQFRNTRLTTKEIGRKLGVARVLEGGVQRAGDRVRITVQLIDAATDVHLWAESYDRKLTAANIFSIQSEIAAAIASALQAALSPAEQAQLKTIPAQNLDAWEAYQLGRQRAANRTSAGLAEAEKYFLRAIDLDPKFALAYAGLAETLDLQVNYAGAAPDATLSTAERAISTALRLDPNLAQAWAISANIALFKRQLDRAELMYRRAIALNPNYASAYQWLSMLLSFMGRADEALGFAQRAVELDPLSAIVNYNLGSCLEAMGRFEEAETRYRMVIEIDPSMPTSYQALGELRGYALNRFADAVLFMEKAKELDPSNPLSQMRLAETYLNLDEVQAAPMIKALQDRRGPDHMDAVALSAMLHLYQGDRKVALQDARKSLPSLNALRILSDADAQKNEYALARAWYAKLLPEFFATEPLKINGSNFLIAIDLVPVLQKTGAGARANVLLDQTEKFIRKIPRMGSGGYGISDVEIYALRGQKREALAALRTAEKVGWRNNWHYYRDFDTGLASIRNEPEFKAVFADIERDMARQRADLAARRKGAPTDLKAMSN